MAKKGQGKTKDEFKLKEEEKEILKKTKLKRSGKCVFCLDCGAEIPTNPELLEGDLLICPDCDQELQVVELGPIIVDYPKREEDEKEIM
ncbi:MAG: hypothetical protein ABH950_10170 [Candidatus Altiarchaeota archaeon]